MCYKHWMKRSISYQPIPEPSGGYVALEIYPPGTWFGSKMFHVFVGGGGRSAHQTLKVAEAALHKLALAACDERIAQAKASLAHFERQRAKLVGGLKRRAR